MKEPHMRLSEINMAGYNMQDHYYTNRDRSNATIEEKINELIEMKEPAPRVVCQITLMTEETIKGYIASKQHETITIHTRRGEQTVAIRHIIKIVPVSFQS